MPDEDVDRRPPDVSDLTVHAVGRLTEALEYVERARGQLYGFHQLIGHADGLLDEVMAELKMAGHTGEADLVRRELVGRDVVPGRWTFQLVEEFDDGYYESFRLVERDCRDALLAGRRHVHEAEMKRQRAWPARPG
jgi:hypothetical protein